MKLQIAIYCSVFAVSCGSIHSDDHISLSGVTDMTYDQMDKSVGSSVCLLGKVYSSQLGSYFPLQPAEEDGVITSGSSRVMVSQSNMSKRVVIVDNETYRICGVIKEITPFPSCTTKRCKWYEIDSRAIRLLR